MRGKKGITPLLIILGIVLVIIIIYCLLFIPIPAFTKLRMIINYFLIIIFWIVLQIGLIYGYYRIGIFVGKSFTIIKTKLLNFSLRIEKYLVTYS
jgi:amino acid transporter